MSVYLSDNCKNISDEIWHYLEPNKLTVLDSDFRKIIKQWFLVAFQDLKIIILISRRN